MEFSYMWHRMELPGTDGVCVAPRDFSSFKPISKCNIGSTTKRILIQFGNVKCTFMPVVLIFFMAMPCYGSATKGRKLSATRIRDLVLMWLIFSCRSLAVVFFCCCFNFDRRNGILWAKARNKNSQNHPLYITIRQARILKPRLLGFPHLF